MLTILLTIAILIYIAPFILAVLTVLICGLLSDEPKSIVVDKKSEINKNN